VAELLINEERAGQEYFLAGPSITMGEVATTISDVIGKNVEYVQVSPHAARSAMEEKGLPKWLMDHMGAMMGFAARNEMGHESEWVQTLTGHAPRTLTDWLTDAKGFFTD